MSPQTFSGNLGDMLLKDGLVTDETLEEALGRQRQTNQPLARILVEMNAITEKVKLNFFQKTFGCDVVSLRDVQIPEILYSYIPAQTAMRYRVIPFKLEGDTLIVAMEDPSDLVILDNLKAQVGLKIRPVIASHEDIEEALQQYPGVGAAEPGTVAETAERQAPSGSARWIKYLFLPVVAFIPLVVFMTMMVVNEQFQNVMSNPPYEMDTGDVVFCIVLIWGLWALFVYEIDGIVVNPEHRERA
jgi:type IV pilus assembly protein PilB